MASSQQENPGENQRKPLQVVPFPDHQFLRIPEEKKKDNDDFLGRAIQESGISDHINALQTVHHSTIEILVDNHVIPINHDNDSPQQSSMYAPNAFNLQVVHQDLSLHQDDPQHIYCDNEADIMTIHCKEAGHDITEFSTFLVNNKKPPDNYKTCPRPYCGYSSGRSFNMNRHMKDVHEDKMAGNPFTCCNVVTRKKGLLELHHAVKHGNHSYQCTVNGCLASFRVQSLLVKHGKTHERAEKRRLNNGIQNTAKKRKKEDSIPNYLQLPPVQMAPVQIAPVEMTPVQMPPVQMAPVQVDPIQMAPVQQLLMIQNPIQQEANQYKMKKNLPSTDRPMMPQKQKMLLKPIPLIDREPFSSIGVVKLEPLFKDVILEEPQLDAVDFGAEVSLPSTASFDEIGGEWMNNDGQLTKEEEEEDILLELHDPQIGDLSQFLCPI